MKPNPFERPKKTVQSPSKKPKKIIIPRQKVDEPYPWLFEPETLLELDPSASFVEYLRWMRSPELVEKDATVLELLQRAQENANYRQRLEQLTQRTKLIAGEVPIAGEQPVFAVTCPWRIRVGGQRGPESILLPAFDALGMPYIPSSTLRGVARCQAIQEFIKQNKTLSWQEADKKVAPYFGSLDAEEKSDRTGKVIFLDAYPLPTPEQPSGGLALDMVNSIWRWEGESPPAYSPNPNLFLSLKKPTFLIGLRKGINCSDEVFIKVKRWLVAGLRAGVGSQINTGYGELHYSGATSSRQPFLQVEFTLCGQLIHSTKKYKDLARLYKRDKKTGQLLDGKLTPDTLAEAEVRAIAFKSMLRYWFRAFGLGRLPSSQVKKLEAKIFGAIDPKARGWVKFQIINKKCVRSEPRSSKDDYGEFKGELLLFHSPEAPTAQEDTITKLMQHLTWLMFHLGGVGQGARRPCYSRQNRHSPKPPYWRGSTLFANRSQELWRLPATLEAFCQKFHEHLRGFYTALEQVQIFYAQQNKESAITLTPQYLEPVSHDHWFDAIDGNCKIVACVGEKINDKPYALSVLHHSDLKVKYKDRQGKEKQRYDPDLCGGSGSNRKPVRPSPVWIADLGDYQVVTVFGATHGSRQEYLKRLQTGTSPQNYLPLWS